jgi:hypothetical protein
MSVELRFDWLDGSGVKGLELAATWCRLSIWLDGVNVTESNDEYLNQLQADLCVPAYPIAEWFATNWWSLWSCTRSPRRIREAETGFALPDLQIESDEASVYLRAEPMRSASARLRFFNSGQATMNLRSFRESVAAFVEGTLSRLVEKQVNDTFLHEEWKRVVEVESSDDEQAREWCRNVARLGLDPFDLDTSADEWIDQALERLPAPVAADLFDSVELAKLAVAVDHLHGFFGDAQKKDQSTETNMNRSLRPWQEGYALAREARAKLGLNGQIQRDLGEVIDSARALIGPISERYLEVPSIAAAATMEGGAWRIGMKQNAREDTRKFRLARIVGEIFASADRGAHLVTTGRRANQRRSRAFAAEFLAPAELLRERLDGAMVDRNRVEELAEEFGVSSDLVRDQILNWKLASLPLD